MANFRSAWKSSRRLFSKLRRRALLRALLASALGFQGGSLFAQDTNNTSSLNFITNGILNSPGAYNNQVGGTLTFNGPNGAAEWSSDTDEINNAGTVTLNRAGLGIIGDVSNTGVMKININGGTIDVDGDFTNSGTGQLLIDGGGVIVLPNDVDESNFTNSSTHANSVKISATRFLNADNITNDAGSTITNSGTLQGNLTITNDGTINSNGVVSKLSGAEIQNNDTINARSIVEGAVTNDADGTFNVVGNLSGNDTLLNPESLTFDNAGTLDVAGGNFTGITTLENTGTVTVGDARTLSGKTITNNEDGTIDVGVGSKLQGETIENNDTINVDEDGQIVSSDTIDNNDTINVGQDGRIVSSEMVNNNADATINFDGTEGTAHLTSGTTEDNSIANEGTINFNAGTVLVTGNLTGEGTLAMADETTFRSGLDNQKIENAVTLGTGNSTFDTNGNDIEIEGTMSGDGGFTKIGSGDMTLSGTNTSTGKIVVTNGQLVVEKGSAIGDTTAVELGASGKLKISDAEQFGSLTTATGSEVILDDELTIAGESDTTSEGKITGTAALKKEGTSTLSLSGTTPNTFTGGVEIDEGTIKTTTDEQLGTGDVTIGEEGTLEIDETTTQSVASVTVHRGTDPNDAGVLDNSGTLDSTARVENSGIINNLVSGSINGGVDNNADGEINNTGTINDGVTNFGTLNNDSSTSKINDGLTNYGEANLQGRVNGGIVNETAADSESVAIMTVQGDLTTDGTVRNGNSLDDARLHVKDGNFTGITTLTNQSGHELGVQVAETRTLGANAITNSFGSTIDNSGTIQSGTAINNSGTVTNNDGGVINGGINNAHARSLVTNNGTINGGITANFGTVNSLDPASVINGGVNNSGYVNAQGQISGAVTNGAQHSFGDLRIEKNAANASGTVTIDSETFTLTADEGLVVGAEGNGPKIIVIDWDASVTEGESVYDPETNTITVQMPGPDATLAQLQAAIDNGSGFTATGGTSSTATISAASATSESLTGGRDAGAAMIRVLAVAPGTAAKDRTVTIIHDSSIDDDSSEASVDPTTNNIEVKVNGDVSYDDIAAAINALPGYNASITAFSGDQEYATTLDTAPSKISMGNGEFNVEGDLIADDDFTNVGALNLNNGDLTGIVTLNNSGDVVIDDGFDLEAETINNTTGDIDVGVDANLLSDSLVNGSTIDVAATGNVHSTGSITNQASGVMTFGLGTGVMAGDVSELDSDTNTIVNEGQIDIAQGTLKTTGNISGNGKIALGDTTTFRTGNDNQTITNTMELADSGSGNFDTDGLNSTVSGSIIGNGVFNKVGTGTLNLSGDNTFTGPANVNAGELNLQDGSAIADQTAVQIAAAGTLRTSTNETIGSLSGAVGSNTILDATLSAGINNTSTTNSGLMSGAGGFVKQGTGTMTLDHSEDNTFSGGTTVEGGQLNADTDNQLGTGDAAVSAGATLVTSADTTQNVASMNNAGTVEIGTGGTLRTTTGNVNNSGTMNVLTDGTVRDAGTLTNSGTINFDGGDSYLTSDTNSIVNEGQIEVEEGTLKVTGSISGDGTIDLADDTTFQTGNDNQTITNTIELEDGGSGSFDTDGLNSTVSGSIVGDGVFNKVGLGTLNLSGNNTFTGPANVNAGEMNLQGGGAISDQTAIHVAAPGTLRTSTDETIGSLSGEAGSKTILDANLSAGINNTSTTNSGVMSGAGGFIKQGTGTMTLDGSVANTFSGGATVEGGQLNADTDNQLGTGDASVSSGATLVTADDTTQNVASMNNAGTVEIGSGGTLRTTTGNVNNSGTMNVLEDGTVRDSGTLTNSGTINFEGGDSYLTSDTNSIVNDGQIEIEEGTLNVTGNISGNGTIELGDEATFLTGNNNQTITSMLELADGGSGNFDTDGFDATISGAIIGDSEFNKVGLGILNLSGNNTFTGPANVDAGELNLQGGSAIADQTTVDVGAAGTLRTSTAETIGSLSGEAGSKTILDATLSAGGDDTNTTNSGEMSGAGGFVKQGTGTMTLNGNVANTYSGGTTVQSGRLNASTNNQLGTGTVTVNSDATLGTGASTTQNVASVNNSGTIEVGSGATLRTTTGHVDNSGTINVSSDGTLRDSGTLQNSGTINFAGGNAYLTSDTNSISNAGTINLNAGTVTVKGDLTGIGKINMADGSTLRSGSANQQIDNGISVLSGMATVDTNGNTVSLNGAVDGDGTLVKSGAGNLTWKGVNNGKTNIDNGVLITATQNIKGDTTLANNATMILDQSTSGSYDGDITGDGELIKSGEGTATLLGDSNYSGGTQVNEGTLRVGQQGTGRVTSNVNVNNGGTLGGGGTIVGNVRSFAGGRIAAGNSIETLNIVGNMDVSGSAVENELNATNTDLINVSGTANIIGARLDNVFEDSNSYRTNRYRIINAAGGLTGRFGTVTNANAPENFLVSTYYTATSANVSLMSVQDAVLASSTNTALLNVGQNFLTDLINQNTSSRMGGLGVKGVSETGQIARGGSNVWFQGVGMFDDVDGTGVLTGYKANTGGGIFGIDSHVSEFAHIGIAGGFTTTDVQINSYNRHSANADTGRIGLYGSMDFDSVIWTAIVSGAFHDIDSDRTLFGFGNAIANYNASEFGAATQITGHLGRDTKSSLLPFMGIQWVSLNQDNFRETGVEGMNFDVASRSIDSVRPYLGLGYRHTMLDAGGSLVSGQLNGRYSFDFETDAEQSTLTINESRFLVSGVETEQHFVGLGGGLQWQLGTFLSTFANYNVNLGDRLSSQLISGGFSYQY